MAPRIYILRVSPVFQPPAAPFIYPAHNRHYGVEQDFLFYLNSHPELLTDDPLWEDWHYLPIFWTNWHLQHDYGRTGRDELQAEVSRCMIDPSRTFTICQYDDGPIADLHNAAVFYSSRKVCTGLDAPLLCASHRIPPAPADKRYLASFVGRIATHPVRCRMLDTVKSRSNVYVHDGDLGTKAFVEAVRSSYLALCPRGYGGSSFRFYEAMQLGVAPCLIGDIDTRPFKQRIPWQECSLYARDAEELASLLDECDPERLRQMGARAKEVYDTHLAYQRWCVHVLQDLPLLGGA
jgi:hypothetical protein